MVGDHLTAIRKHPLLRDVYIIFVPEANLGHEGSYLKSAAYRALRNHNIEVPVINKSDRPGIITTDTVKDDAGEILKLALARRAVSFMENFIVANPWDNQHDPMRRTKLVEKLVMQLGSVRNIMLESTNIFGMPRRSKSGKSDALGKRIANRNDDMFMALSLAVYAEQMYAEGTLTNARGLMCR